MRKKGGGVVKRLIWEKFKTMLERREKKTLECQLGGNDIEMLF